MSEARLHGRVAVVTGGGRGIGRAIALGLAAEGARVAVIARTASQLDAVVAEAAERGGGGLALVADCMDGPALKAAVAERNVFLNLTTAYYATRAALPLMVEGGYGRVLNIGSGYATHGGGTIGYSAGKHGLVGFTRALAYQVPKEATVNCLCLGWTNTSLITGQVISVDGGYKV